MKGKSVVRVIEPIENKTTHHFMMRCVLAQHISLLTLYTKYGHPTLEQLKLEEYQKGTFLCQTKIAR